MVIAWVVVVRSSGRRAGPWSYYSWWHSAIPVCSLFLWNGEIGIMKKGNLFVRVSNLGRKTDCKRILWKKCEKAFFHSQGQQTWQRGRCHSFRGLSFWFYFLSCKLCANERTQEIMFCLSLGVDYGAFSSSPDSFHAKRFEKGKSYHCVTSLVGYRLLNSCQSALLFWVFFLFKFYFHSASSYAQISSSIFIDAGWGKGRGKK